MFREMIMGLFKMVLIILATVGSIEILKIFSLSLIYGLVVAVIAVITLIVTGMNIRNRMIDMLFTKGWF